MSEAPGTLTDLLRQHRADGWSCSCGWPLDDSVGSWVDHLAAEIEPLMRCSVADPSGTPCRLHAGHGGQHGDGLGTVWDGSRVPSTSGGEGT